MTDLLHNIEALIAERDTLAARVQLLEQEREQIISLLSKPKPLDPPKPNPKPKKERPPRPEISQVEQVFTILLDAAKSGDPWVTSKTLKDATGISSGSLCSVIARLRKRGLLLTKVDPTHGQRRLYAHADIDKHTPPALITEEQQQILNTLNGKPKPLRDLYRVTQIPVATLESTLETLRARGDAKHTKTGWTRA